MATAQRSGRNDSIGGSLDAEKISRSKFLSGSLVLIGLGLGLGGPSTAQEMCTIQGEQGPCKIEAFLDGEHKDDQEGHTCAKLNGIKYKGTCREGRVDGLVLLHRPADRRFDRRDGDQFLVMVKAEQIQYPVATFNHQTVGVNYKDGSRGCVNFVQGWDALADNLCIRLTNAFGTQIIKRETWRAIRTGNFDLRSAGWNPAAGENHLTAGTSRGDDPKTTGRGARVE